MALHLSTTLFLCLILGCTPASQAAEAASSASSAVKSKASHRTQAMVRNRLVRGVREALVPQSQLKDMLSKVLQNKQMQQMVKDPHLVSGLMELMHDPQKMDQLTHDPDLSQALYEMVEKDPESLQQVLRDAGFEVPMSLDYVNGATLEEIHAEFRRLSTSDRDHMQRLKKNTALRNELKETLGAVVEHAIRANNRVDKRLGDIREVGKSKSRKAVSVEQDGSMEPSVSMLETFKSDKLDELEELGTAEEIGSNLVEYGKMINKEMHLLEKQDDIELAALMDNSEIRAALKDRLEKHIAEQQKELSFAEDGETRSLEDLQS